MYLIFSYLLIYYAPNFEKVCVRKGGVGAEWGWAGGSGGGGGGGYFLLACPFVHSFVRSFVRHAILCIA